MEVAFPFRGRFSAACILCTKSSTCTWSVRKSLNVEPRLVNMLRSQQQSFGHVCGMSQQWLVRQALLHTRESGPEADQGLSGVFASPILLCLALVWASCPIKYWCWPCGISSRSWAVSPAILPRDAPQSRCKNDCMKIVWIETKWYNKTWCWSRKCDWKHSKLSALQKTFLGFVDSFKDQSNEMPLSRIIYAVRG